MTGTLHPYKLYRLPSQSYSNWLLFDGTDERLMLNQPGKVLNKGCPFEMPVHVKVFREGFYFHKENLANCRSQLRCMFDIWQGVYLL